MQSQSTSKPKHWFLKEVPGIGVSTLFSEPRSISNSCLLEQLLATSRRPFESTLTHCSTWSRSSTVDRPSYRSSQTSLYLPQTQSLPAEQAREQGLKSSGIAVLRQWVGRGGVQGVRSMPTRMRSESTAGWEGARTGGGSSWHGTHPIKEWHLGLSINSPANIMDQVAPHLILSLLTQEPHSGEEILAFGGTRLVLSGGLYLWLLADSRTEPTELEAFALFALADCTLVVLKNPIMRETIVSHYWHFQNRLVHCSDQDQLFEPLLLVAVSGEERDRRKGKGLSACKYIQAEKDLLANNQVQKLLQERSKLNSKVRLSLEELRYLLEELSGLDIVDAKVALLKMKLHLQRLQKDSAAPRPGGQAELPSGEAAQKELHRQKELQESVGRILWSQGRTAVLSIRTRGLTPSLVVQQFVKQIDEQIAIVYSRFGVGGSTALVDVELDRINALLEGLREDIASQAQPIADLSVQEVQQALQRVRWRGGGGVGRWWAGGKWLVGLLVGWGAGLLEWHQLGLLCAIVLFTFSSKFSLLA